MTQLLDERLVQLLRTALPPPVDSTGADLWPRVRQRIDRGAPPPAAMDWALAIVAVVLCAIEPAAISLLMFHL